MSDYDWAERFRQCWDRAVETYRNGNRQPVSYPAMPDIGCSSQEMYDYAEDAPELSHDTALLITAARRDFFLVVQHGQPTGHVIPVSDFPPKDAEVAGFAWLPRLILKARCKLRGELPAELMYGCGGDRAFFKKVNVHPADFLRVVWAARADDQKIIEYVKQCSCQSL
jgi:hypothetical protein